MWKKKIREEDINPYRKIHWAGPCETRPTEQYVVVVNGICETYPSLQMAIAARDRLEYATLMPSGVSFYETREANYA